MSQYILVRITSMTYVDIGLFDYDRHNALYYFIMNADEQIYMRYGGRDATSPTAYLDLNSIQLALELGLQKHALYKQGKIGKQIRPETLFPKDIPLLKQKVINRRRCVECHLIADYQTQELENAGKLNKIKDMYVSPDIRTIGINLDIPKGLQVESVNGAAKDSGMLAGDLITEINSTPVLTFGDFQHFYNKVSRDADQIIINVNRKGTNKKLTVALPPEWWVTNLEHRYWTIDPVLMIETENLSPEEKKKYGLRPEGFAGKVLAIKPEMQRYPLHDLKRNDIIYSVEGVESDPRTKSFKTYIKLALRSGTDFKVKLIRNGKQMELMIASGRFSYRK